MNTGLKIRTYNPEEKGIFAVTSTLIYGDKEAILVDAQFENDHAENVVLMIKETQCNLKAIYISHSDPDFYFGTSIIREAFPDAKVYSTAQTAYLISVSKDEKMETWKESLGSGAPKEIIIPEAISKSFTVEGKEIQIVEHKKDLAHSYLWIPSEKTILGGISIATGAHLWLADTQEKNGIDLWINQIEEMKALEPKKIIPSHYLEADFSPVVLDLVKDYLENFQEIIKKSNDPEVIIKTMEERYPDLKGKESLLMSANVLTGKQFWEVKNPYPAIGRTVQVDFEGNKFDLNFRDNKTMSFQGAEGRFAGIADNVQYTATEVAPYVFMVYWHEPKEGANVVHLQNYNNHIVYTNISSKEGSFVNMKGTLYITEEN